MIHVDHHEISNGDGWLLSLRRTHDPDALVAGRNPLLIVPGYGMNSFIFSFHPDGPSMEASLASRGFEVWAVDLRGQGRARRDGGTMRYGLSDLVLKDVFAAVHGVLGKTALSSGRVDLIGCSLGGTMVLAYVACVQDHRVGRLVNMGGPVRWVRIHPMIEVAFRSPALVGKIPLRGIRRLARLVLPALKRVPWLLSMYIHPAIVDLSKSDKLIQTVENPNRHVNREIGEWLKGRDLVIGNVNVSERVRTMQVPLLTVVANADGIVPRESVLWPHLNTASRRRDVLEVGTHAIPMAHADMFVSRHAPQMVFTPLADWLQG